MWFAAAWLLMLFCVFLVDCIPAGRAQRGHGRYLPPCCLDADPDLLLLNIPCCMSFLQQGGRSVDTTMGLTPLEGLMMGTRCGERAGPAEPAVHAKLDGRPRLSRRHACCKR